MLGIPQAKLVSEPIRKERNPESNVTAGLPLVRKMTDTNQSKQAEEQKIQQDIKAAEALAKQQEADEKKPKLADYFITVGIDDFHRTDQINGEETKRDMEIESKPNINFEFMDSDLHPDFDKVISKLEIFVIKDDSIFNDEMKINGVNAVVKHPEDIDLPNEKWIDMRGDRYIYLKITFEDIKKCKRPITDINFYKISRVKQQ